mmetsp:Transcript_548/g.556  ORF Transcript_548/g.556 Transcript_548/m.556 type:complete len:122 (+) Transcript_548:94-459(+)|eukprot:CAMPEP_0182416326 /NCGR_PEP_ID=MMETSP1167-20130531/593_1 /TAXON_ID=2988 /ORGANISM="Mallomonas Sp, Strain CCMP3275" /LENGTH=121 /DNA_ID=CAMNT_0024588989 /DNA_START=99 /DNA_END=464 /DNA_ORIENTATION=+
MPMTNKPSYPVVDVDPSLGKAIASFHFTDYLTVVGFASSGFVMGWFGARKPFRTYNSRFLCSIGLVAGIMYAVQNSTCRLVGIRENKSEVAAYGVMSAESIAEHNERSTVPNIDLIKALKQ